MRQSHTKKNALHTANALNEVLAQAAALCQAGRLEDARQLYRPLENMPGGCVAATFQLAMIDIKSGQLARAARRLQSAAKWDPHSFFVFYNLGYVNQTLGRWTDAAKAFGHAMTLQPNSDERLRLAVSLASLGQLDDAIACYRKLAENPQTRLNALVRLTVLSPKALTADEAKTLLAASGSQEIDRELRVALSFAQGEVLELQNKFDAAFEAFTRGNRLKRESLDGESNPDIVAYNHGNQIASTKLRFDSDFFNRNRNTGHSSNAPIFIVGMPRSGSTLIEQILSSHRNVQGLGENSRFIRTVWQAYPYDLAAPRTKNYYRHLAQHFLDAMKNIGWRSNPRFVDKSLDNYLHIGMIHLLFPNAIILESRRDPIDTCVSCFRQLFTGDGNETTYDLRDIGAEYVRYRDMMDHWSNVLPGKVVTVKYEDLVANPEAQIRRLVTESCKLPWDDACLKYHESTQPVRTASVGQVRRPIFTDSIERWRRYEKHLGPLLETLGPYASK